MTTKGKTKLKKHPEDQNQGNLLTPVDKITPSSVNPEQGIPENSSSYM